MKDLTRYARRKWALSFPVALVFAAASYAWADFGPPQGSGGGGGGISNPLTATLNGGGFSLENFGEAQVAGAVYCDSLDAQSGSAIAVNTNLTLSESALLRFGGETSTYPAMRYGSSAGYVELLRADGSADFVGIRATHADGMSLESDNGSANVSVDDAAASALFGTNGVKVTTSAVELRESGSVVAYVGSQGLSVVGTDAFNLKDVTSAPSVTAGYQGVYSLNTSGLQQLVVKGGSGAVTLATQGYYAAGGYFVVYKSADQTFSSSGEAVTWSGEDADQPGGVDTATYNTRVFTAPVAGTVTVEFKWRFAADADHTVAQPAQVIVRRYNSSDVEQTGRGDRQDHQIFGRGGNITLGMHTLVFHMSAGDYLIAGIAVTNNVDLDDGGSAAATAAICKGLFVPD